MWVFLNAFWRTGLMTVLIFGLHQFIFEGQEASYLRITLVGFVIGCVAGLIAFEKSRKFTENRPLMADEILIEEGTAAYEEKTGWFYLTNKRFFFISTDEKPTIRALFQPNGESFSIMFSELVSAETEYKFGIIPKQLVLNLKNGAREEFIVDNTKHLVKQIKSASGLLLKAPRT